MITTRFTQLVGCRVPVQQAGMGGVSTPELASAVARAGGLGMLAGAGVPPAPLIEMLAAATAASDGGAVGVNFLMPFLNDATVVDHVSRQARVVEFFYGNPDADLVARVHAGGALAFWQVGSVGEAQSAEAAGCDAVVVQGSEAGGHVRGTTSLLPLLAVTLDRVKIPVIAAGGIATARDVAAALAAGASAVRVGTRFLATAESGAHPQYVAALLAANAEDTVLTEAFSTGWPDAPHRVLRSCIAAAAAHGDEVVAKTRFGATMVPVPRFSVEPPSRATEGQIAAMALYAGESAGAVSAVVPAADLVHELVDGADALLQRFSR